LDDDAPRGTLEDQRVGGPVGTHSRRLLRRDAHGGPVRNDKISLPAP